MLLDGRSLKAGVAEKGEGNPNTDYEDRQEQLTQMKTILFERKLNQVDNWHCCPNPYGCLDGAVAEDPHGHDFHCRQCQCQGNLRAREDRTVENTMEEHAGIDGTIRPCPYCGLLVEREAGCALMRCGQCHRDWHFNYGTMENFRAVENDYRLGNEEVRQQDHFQGRWQRTGLEATRPNHPGEHEFIFRRRLYELPEGIEPHFEIE